MPKSDKHGGGGGGGGGVVSNELGPLEQKLSEIGPNDASHDFENDKPTTLEQIKAYKKGLYKGSGNDIHYGSEAESLSMVVSHVDGIAKVDYIPMVIANPDKDFCHTSKHDIQTVNDKPYTVHYADVKWTPNAKKKYGTAEFDSVTVGINADKNKKKKEAQATKAEMDAKIDELKANEKKGFIQNLKEKIDEIRRAHKAAAAAAKEEEPNDDREEINAPMFYKMMGIDVTQTIAIVVDAASIGLIQILSKGTFTGRRPIVYYMYGPEVHHDPAKKKHPSSPEFRDTGEGVIFIPCVSLNPPSFVYSYSYVQDDISNLYLNKFFTSFKFELSELITTSKGKTDEYSTDLTIKAFDNDGNIKFVDESIDSKSKCDISFLTKIIDVLKDALLNSDEKQFKYAISFFKKMSGDWLQVLLTLAIASRTRGFTPYARDRENVTAKIDRVFFVTHDQIALSFALLMGVECLFTHHGPVEGNPSLHSIFLYSLASDADVNKSIIEKAMALTPNYDEEIAKIAKIATDLATYNEKYETAIRGSNDTLTGQLDRDLEYTIESPFRVDVFDGYVKHIFTTALKVVATKKTLPDLRSFRTKGIQREYSKFETSVAAFKSSEPHDVVKAKELLEIDGRIKTELENLRKIIESASYFFESKNNDGKMNINGLISDVAKTLIYAAANQWTWNSTEVSSRILSQFTIMRETRAYNADRNIFLNNLDSLDDKFKFKITLLFARCYDFIQKNNDRTKFQNTIKKSKGKTETTILTEPQFQKFKSMATCFCYEVFINFGKFKIEDAPADKSAASSSKSVAEHEITHTNIDEFCDRIVAADALISMSMIDDVSKEHVPSHLSEETLVAQMNESTGKLDDKVDDFEKEIKEEITPPPAAASALSGSGATAATATTAATTAAAVPALSGSGGGGAPLPQLPKSKFSMVFNSVVASCRLLKHRFFGGGGGDGGGGGGLEYEGKGGSKIRMKGGAPPTCNFHHQLPLYILLFQLHKTLSNENFKESSDFELTLQYYDFLLKIKDKFAELKEEEKENACAIGLGMRDLFFINNVVSDNVKIKSLPSVLKNMPSKMTSLSGLLTTDFCGALNEEYFKDDVSVRQETLTNSVFVDFIESVDIPGCFKTPYDLIMDKIDYKDFVQAVSQSASDVAQQIVADRASKREQMINKSDLIRKSNVIKDEGKRGADSGIITHPGLTAAEKQQENPMFSEFSGPPGLSGPPQGLSHGGRKTRRRKRTRKPKKSINKKTRKRRI